MKQLEKEHIANWFMSLQDQICNSLEEIDGSAKFEEDQWSRPEGGGGRSRAIKNGPLIEKGGVNFSAVSGPTPEKILAALKLSMADFFATGVSIVLHPQNPWVPIIHMNVRYFEMSNGVWWFGGGIDLTPHYVIEEQARAFHQHLKDICDKHHPDFYFKFKRWADDYFYVKHRSETRGIGGIFFDRLTDKEGRTKEEQWDFVKDVGQTFIPAYSDAVEKVRHKEWSDEDKLWQKIRRGRYVEFNLVHDKGTKFGLDTNGRTESILMSMPPEANWAYEYQPKTDLQRATLEALRKDIDWV
ncbi:MAG: oxygen-dependent coproporphyrinogen oxidase [Ekhidna sp.]|nr:oxygen-dependent coproporphyrinogen oxidase [Ekhidna sp.]